MSRQLKLHSTIVIGSGFGGAVAASTLVDAGESVLLLERGPWRDTDPIRLAGIGNRAALPNGWRAFTHLLHRLEIPGVPVIKSHSFRNGLFDIHLNSDMSVVCSNGVGGGSHVYSALNTRPEQSDYWDGYVDEVTSQSMEAHYSWMINRMGAHQVSETSGVPNTVQKEYKDSKSFIADESLSQPDMSIRLDGNHDDYENNSFFGSANGAKATLDKVLLLPAIEKGLEVAANHECLSIWKTAEGHFRLEIMDHGRRRRKYLLTERVILAAGTINTLRLLFHSRAQGGLQGMPALGRGFGGNGDSVAWWALNDAGADYSLGTPAHGRFALRHLESGDALPGPYVIRGGFNGINKLPLPRGIKARLRRDAILVGMGVDQADGVALWRRGRLVIRYIAENSSVLSAIQEFFSEVARRSKKPVRFLKNLQVTVHPLGGARLAANEQEGVVDGAGEVYGLPGLYIADASALPAAPGMPPSMTIASWARHLALGLAAKTDQSAHQSMLAKAV